VIDELLRNNLIIREWLNGGLLPLNLSLVLVIGLFLFDSWRTPDVRTWLDMNRVPGVSTGCALLWIFIADALRAGTAWVVLRELNDGGPRVLAQGVVPETMVAINVAFILAGVIGLLASVRCIYLFTPQWLGHWYWIGTVAVMLTFQVLT
jgi:hypothetical protein